ncbi:MAG: trypsin-like peptidase domain-containing protein [Acetobacteraceae bacterium]|nr:trypsin-like peptidase domain-containing protein [Acetobacteraceae bacterium]
MVVLRRSWLVLIVVTAALLGGLAAGGAVFLAGGGHFGEEGPGEGAAPPAPDGGGSPAPLPPASASVVEVAERVAPAVVGVSTVRLTYDFFYRPVPVEGVGSGVIVDPRGYILTNEHVVGGAKEIQVVLSDGRKLPAKCLWSGADLDLAVIKVEGAGLPAAPMGDSEQLRVGEPAIAIGNPLGLKFQRSVTAGIISALGRSIQVPGSDGSRIMEDLIQTDASINPGNSGGPLVNLRGEVVGINTAKVSGAEGLGFAIPINLARPIVEDVIEHGRFLRPWLGVSVVDRETAAYYDEEIKVERGVLLVRVAEGGPAERAGLKEGDILLEVGGRKVDSIADLRRALFAAEAGQRVEVVYLRGSRERRVGVVLQEMPQD